jgi:glutathione S-transferase
LAGLTLYTFPPSLDSEFSRFLLRHYQVAAREERHVIIFQSFVTLARAGTPRIPTLQGGDAHRLDTVTKIFNYLEAHAAPDRKLLSGVDPTRMAADWNDFHRVMQTASTVFPYYHLVPRRDLMVRALSEGAPAFEVEAVQRAYPAFELLLRVLLRLTAKRGAQARDAILAHLEAMDKRIADGRPYINGDRFTLTDMSFTIAAAPAVWPDNYGGPLPPLAAMPAPVQELVSEARQHPSGQFALRIYRDHRDSG